MHSSAALELSSCASEKAIRKLLYIHYSIPCSSRLLSWQAERVNKWILSVMSPSSAGDPRTLFDSYDVDSDGVISLDEFRLMLPQLGLHVSPAKSLSFFRHYDADNSGGIDYDELLALLFACNSNENPAGFAPSERMAPKDAFCIFDQDRSGAIDEDEFFYLLQYMGIDADEGTRERLFAKYDRDKNGTISYSEFKQVWLYLTDARRELEERDIPIPKFASKNHLIKMLHDVLLEEEQMEAEAFRYADAWRRRQQDERRRQEELSAAEERLCRALDTLGQVVLLGGGINNQFNADFSSAAQATNNECESLFPPEWLDQLQSLWTRRLLKNTYQGLNICKSTFALWGRRPKQIALTESVAFCLFGGGDLHAWGGTKAWWSEQEESFSADRLTPRSRDLLEVPKTQHWISSICRAYINCDESISSEALKTCLEYYGCWNPPPGNGDVEAHYFSLLEHVEASRVRQSVQLRGKPCDDFSRVEMLRLLADDIVLEKRILGEAGHLKLREIDVQISQLKKRRKSKLVKRLSLQFTQVWQGSLQEAQMVAMREKASQREEAKQRLMDRLLRCLENWSDGSDPKYASVVAGASHAGVITSSSSEGKSESSLYTWGTAPAGRLGSSETSDHGTGDILSSKIRVEGLNNVVDASFGSSHCAAIANQGSLYVWGSSTSGKLGLGRFDDRECYVSSPRPLQLPVKGATRGIVRRVSCGANHSACVSSQGHLYVWGSGAGGRLGLGSQNMTKQLTVPCLVESLLHETVADVSCGGQQTLVSTEVVIDVSGKGRMKVRGGLLYCCGPANCLGKSFPEFTHVSIESVDGVIRVRQLSAGHCHQAVISTEDELFCWGRNSDGCCGRDQANHSFVGRPTLVSSLYVKPQNLAYLRPCRQSSVYGNHTAANAVDGDADGDNNNNNNNTAYLQTLIDPQPFWEVDLQDICSIKSIKIWSSIDVSSSSVDADKIIQKLAPYWLIVSKNPLNDCNGLQDALDRSDLSLRVTRGSQEFEWTLPFDTVGRYIRVQKEKYESLRLCQVEVFGYYDIDRVMTPVLSVTAGRDVTGIVLSSVAPDEGQIVRAFKDVMEVK